MRRWGLAAMVLALAACSTPDSVPPPAPAGPPPPMVREPEPSPPADACGAQQHQHLVGRPRSEIPVPVDPSKQRVACTTCPVTLDFRPDRLNFFFDAKTGLIKEVRCG